MDKHLDEYNKLLKRLDKAFEYNIKVAIEEGSKEFKALENIIKRLAELELLLKNG